MSNYECRMRASQLLKNRYGEAFFAVTICLGAFFILKIFDAAQILFIFHENDMDTKELIFGNSWWEQVLKLLYAVLILAVMTPFVTGGLWWFYETVSGGDNKSILKLYAGVKLNIRAFFLYLLMWVKSVISLIPSGICFGAAMLIYRRAELFEEQGMMLFAAVEIFMIGVFLLGLYLRCITKIFLAPFIFIERPDMPVHKILKLSGSIIFGAKLECLKLIMTYFAPMLFIVTVPFILPRAVMAFSVFAKDKIGGGSIKC